LHQGVNDGAGDEFVAVDATDNGHGIAGLSPVAAASLLTAAGGGTATHGISLMLVAAGLIGATAIWFAGETGRRDLSDIDAH
jgi:hypothetical protein